MSNSAHNVLSNRIMRVEAGAPLRRSRVATRTASHAAIFASGDCLGVLRLEGDVLSSHDKTYGDLVGRQVCVDVHEKMSVEELGRLFEDAEIEALIVRSDAGQFVGAVTRQSLLDGLTKERTPSEKPSARNGKLAAAQSEQVLSGERQFLECLLTADSADGGLTELVEVIESLSDGMICSILLMDDDGTRLRSGAAVSLPDEYVQASNGIPVGPNAGSCGTAAFLNETVIVSDIATDPLWAEVREFALKHGLRSCWSVPIRSVRGQVLGTFAMYYREPRSPDAYHQHLIERAVHLAAIAIERRQAEESLLRGEQRLRRAQQIAHVGSYELTPNGTPTYWSDECFRMFGLDPDGELPTRAYFLENVVHPDDRELCRQVVDQALQERTSFNHEYRVVRPDGTVRWAHTVGHPNCDGTNQIVSVEGTILDITERKTSELKLFESERKFRTMFESVTECVKLLDADGNLLEMNATGLRLIEADAMDQVRGMSIFQLIVPEYQQEFGENLRAVFAGESNSQEFEIIGLRGARRWMEAHQVPLRNEQGEVSSLLAVTRDITERKRADDLLQALVEGTAGATGADFFASFTRALARVFEARYIVVCEHLDSPPTRTRTVAFWMHDRLGENIEYDLAGGPCEETVNGKMTFYPSGIQELFPKDKDLVEMKAESYCGIPLVNSSGRVIGHLAMLDDRPMERNLCEFPAMPVFVARAAAEIDRLQVERSLRESKQRLKAVISHLPVIITTVNQDGDILLFDGRGIESLGFWPGQFVGRNYFDLWRERPELTNSLGECLRGRVPEVTTIDVGDRRLETRYSPVRNSQNEVTGAITVCVDVTARVRAEEDARRHRNELAHVSRVSTMGEMATGIAHELNQPLAAIAAYSETAKLIVEQQSADADELPDMLGRLKDQAIRAGRIVQRLRSYVKKSEPVCTRVDLHTLVRNVAKFVDPDIQQAGVALRLEFAEPSPHVFVDEIQMQQVLVNLVRNAIDAMQETPDELRELTITSRNRDDGQVEVAVRDAGAGLPQEDLSHVFDTFYTTKQDGMGMGLPISRSIIESHGGKLWAKPNESVGMTFGFSIPRIADV